MPNESDCLINPDGEIDLIDPCEDGDGTAADADHVVNQVSASDKTTATTDASRTDHSNHQGQMAFPRIMKYVPRCWRFDNAPIEATGLSIDAYGRGHSMMSMLFLGPALLDLATAAAAQSNCGNLEELQDNNQQVCKIYGFRPSSLLSNIAIFSGILGSLSMPFIGAVVDHTPYRRQVAAVSAIALATINGIEVSVGPKTWFLVAILQVVTYVLYDIHATAAFAYTSELSDDHNAKAKYNSSYNAILYVSMLVFLIQVSGVSTLLGTHDLGTARISQIITSSTTLVCFSLAWKYLFRNRPASSRLPEGSSLWTFGFTKVGDTSRRIIKHCRPLMWATIAMMFSEAAVRIHFLCKPTTKRSSHSSVLVVLCAPFLIHYPLYIAQ